MITVSAIESASLDRDSSTQALPEKGAHQIERLDLVERDRARAA